MGGDVKVLTIPGVILTMLGLVGVSTASAQTDVVPPEVGSFELLTAGPLGIGDAVSIAVEVEDPSGLGYVSVHYKDSRGKSHWVSANPAGSGGRVLLSSIIDAGWAGGPVSVFGLTATDRLSNLVTYYGDGRKETYPGGISRHDRDLSTLEFTVSGAPSRIEQVSVVPAIGAVLVSWQAPVSDGGSPVTGYVVTASPGDGSCSTTGALSCTVTGLTNGAAYTFTVTASNAAGTSPPSAPSSPVTPESPITKPGAVTALKAVPIKGGLRVTWRGPADRGGAETVTYQYRAGKGAWTATNKSTVRVLGVRGKVLSLSVRAVNAAGPGPSRTVRAKPR